jgi:hypothetical protein
MQEFNLISCKKFWFNGCQFFIVRLRFRLYEGRVVIPLIVSTSNHCVPVPKQNLYCH